MNLTDYQAKYFAHELTKRCPSDSLEKLAGALVDAQVDLNPHQIEAALFAFRSPFSKGAILADEVGLGKTIEAGLECEIKDLDRQIKEVRRAASTAPMLEDKLAGQKQVKALESQRNTKRRALFDAQDEIDRRREQLIAEIEGKLQQRVSQTTLFSIRWTLA